jgi:peroxisomal membrane protein 4
MLLAVLRGLRNGIYYGAKVRFPHALVMTLLFRRDSLPRMAKQVISLTLQHAISLGAFVSLYKLLVRVLTIISTGNNNNGMIVVVSGAVAGATVFGTGSPISMQINLYVMARVILALAKYSVELKMVPDLRQWTHRVFAAIVWGLVMVIFDKRQDLLQSSLATSMVFLYRDSERWPSHLSDWLFKW